MGGQRGHLEPLVPLGRGNNTKCYIPNVNIDVHIRGDKNRNEAINLCKL